MAVMNMNYLVTGKAPGRAGNAHQNIVPYQVFACADGHVIVAVGNDAQFAKFCDAAGRPEWATDRSLREERRPCPLSRRAGAAHRRRDEDAHAARVARGARTAGRALRSDQPDRPGLRRSAARCAGSPHGPSASARRHRAAGRHADRILGDAAAATSARRRSSASTRPSCCASGSASTDEAIAALAARGVDRRARVMHRDRV